MLPEEIKEAIREAYKKLGESMPGFRPRGAQRRMIAEVANILSGARNTKTRIGVIEGQTGTGKSIGYMLGAIPTAQHEQKKLVISTATVALQEQLIKRDLPTLRAATGLDFTFTLAKGRGRYVCPRNLTQLAGSNNDQAALDFGAEHEGSAAWDRPPKDGEMDMIQSMEARLQDDWNGDLDDWGRPIDSELRKMLTTNQSGCSGRSCAYIRQCPFFKARHGMKDHDVIVANHDLVLVDIELEGGVILPAPEDTFYIFDEGHHLPDKAVSHFSCESRLRGAKSWMDTAQSTAERVRSLLQGSSRAGKHGERVSGLIPQLQDRVREFAEVIEQNFPEPKTRPGRKPKARLAQIESDWWRFEMGVVPDEFRAMAERMQGYSTPLQASLIALHELLDTAMQERTVSPSAGERLLQELGHSVTRAETFSRLWGIWARTDREGAAPIARWIERHKDGARTDYSVAASPVTAASMLKHLLWRQCAGAIVTSATITSLGHFARFNRSAGLRESDGVEYLRLPSPFNYEQSAELHVPWMDSDPRNQEAHTNEVQAKLVEHINPNEGTLVLFSSAWQMRAVHKGLPKHLRALVLMQNDASKQEILQRHNEKISAGSGSVIFGLASFAEGVDLPGELCRHVVIAKLPFATPDSPGLATLSEWIEAQGRNAFMEITVPDASLKLIQACGRLIRTESDHGRVTLLDRRVVTKRYGAQLLDALPPFRRIIERTPPPRQAAV